VASIKSNIIPALIVGGAIVFAVFLYTGSRSKELERQLEEQCAAETQKQQRLDTCLEDARLEGRRWLLDLAEAAAKEGTSLTNDHFKAIADMYEKDKDECYRRYPPE